MLKTGTNKYVSSDGCNQFVKEIDGFKATFAFNFTEKPGNLAFAVVIKSDLSDVLDVKFTNTTNPVRRNNSRYWIDHSEIV